MISIPTWLAGIIIQLIGSLIVHLLAVQKLRSEVDQLQRSTDKLHERQDTTQANINGIQTSIALHENDIQAIKDGQLTPIQHQPESHPKRPRRNTGVQTVPSLPRKPPEK